MITINGIDVCDDIMESYYRIEYWLDRSRNVWIIQLYDRYTAEPIEILEARTTKARDYKIQKLCDAYAVTDVMNRWGKKDYGWS